MPNLNLIKTIRTRRAAKRYENYIAEMQANIGPYVPASIPVQIWA